MRDELKTIRLCLGLGVEGQAGCWMAALSQWSGRGEWTDRLDCVSPAINALCIAVNDTLSDDRRSEVIIGGGWLALPLGTKDEQAEPERLRILVDAAYDWAADALFAAGLREQADRVRTLRTPEVARSAAEEAEEAAEEAAGAAWAARSAAARAAEEAAWAARSAAAWAAVATRSARSAAAWAAAARAEAEADPRAAGDAYVVDHVLPVLRRMIDAGKRAPVEPACDVPAVLAAMGARK